MHSIDLMSMKMQYLSTRVSDETYGENHTGSRLLLLPSELTLVAAVRPSFYGAQFSAVLVAR